VITAESNGNEPKFGFKTIATPDEIHTGSYISFEVHNREEAESLLSYLETKLVNYLLSIRKTTQHISKNTCKLIPLVPFDRIWNDQLLIDYFGLSIEESKMFLSND
jgi:site-specific DNA-methyltransferase (adenine-specific)